MTMNSCSFLLGVSVIFFFQLIYTDYAYFDKKKIFTSETRPLLGPLKKIYVSLPPAIQDGYNF